MQKILLSACVSLLSLSLFAQSNSKQEAIEGNLRSIDTLMASKGVFQSLDIAPELTSIDVEDVNNWAADLQKSEFSKLGLEYTLGYDHRYFDYDKVDDSYEGGSIIAYKHRFLVSLKWNIMQSGLIGRDNFRQKIDILSRTKSQEVANDEMRYFVSESAEQQIAKLHGYYNVLIDAKAELYRVLIDMQAELVANNKATALSLSDMKIQRTAVLRMHKSEVKSGSGIIDLEGYAASQNFFVGDEYNSLLESNRAIGQSKLEQELILNEADGISYWKEIGVSPYARVTNYLDDQNNNKNIGNFGVTATFPIFTNIKHKRREVASRGKLLANEEVRLRNNISLKVADLLQQLNENLATLNLLVEGSKYYSESCYLATQYYGNKTMTIQELSQRYIDSLDNNIEIYKLIIEREKLKCALFEVIYGV